ncbi:MAG: cytochrome c3 family protein [bacterium]
MKKTLLSIIIMSLCMLSIPLVHAGNPGAAPSMVTLKSIEDQYEAVKFDHEKHVAISSSCAACHHEHPSGKAMSCSGCHAIDKSVYKKSVTSSFLSCRTCHDKPDPANPGTPSLKVAYHGKCFECHRGMNNVGTDPKGCTELCHAKKMQKVTAAHIPSAMAAPSNK